MSDLHMLARLALLFACSGAATAASGASGIPDPLAPPGQIAAPSAADDAAPLAAARLQATRVGPDDGFAVIDGTTVRRGERVGDAVVVRIEAASVTLHGDDNTERVLRFDAPGMSKRPAGRNGTQP